MHSCQCSGIITWHMLEKRSKNDVFIKDKCQVGRVGNAIVPAVGWVESCSRKSAPGSYPTWKDDKDIGSEKISLRFQRITSAGCRFNSRSRFINPSKFSRLRKVIQLMQLLRTAKTKRRKFETNIPRKKNIGASVPISTFMCLCIFPRWVCLFCWRKYVDWSWEYINRSKTHECGNWGWGRAIPRKGIYKRKLLI